MPASAALCPGSVFRPEAPIPRGARWSRLPPICAGVNELPQLSTSFEWNENGCNILPTSNTRPKGQTVQKSELANACLAVLSGLVWFGYSTLELDNQGKLDNHLLIFEAL